MNAPNIANRVTRRLGYGGVLWPACPLRSRGRERREKDAKRTLKGRGMDCLTAPAGAKSGRFAALLNSNVWLNIRGIRAVKSARVRALTSPCDERRMRFTHGECQRSRSRQLRILQAGCHALRFCLLYSFITLINRRHWFTNA